MSGKQAIRQDVRYIRQMLRQMEAALKAGDYATVIDCGNEASCAAAEIMQRASEVSGLDLP